MRVLIGHDGSSYADAAIEDLKRAGLPQTVEALVVTVGEPPELAPIANGGRVDHTFTGEHVRSIVDHANKQAAVSLSQEKSFARNAAAKLSSYVTADDTASRGWPPGGVFRDIFVGDLRVSAAAVEGDAEEVLLAEARRSDADCIVIGSGLLSVAANAECSVEIIR